MFRKKLIALLMISVVLLSACGGNKATATPTVDPNMVQTQAVGTFSAALTQTALAQPTIQFFPTLTASPTVGPIVTIPSTPLAITQPPAAATKSCYNLSFVKDVTIPDNTPVAPGQTFTKTWKVINNGSCPWEAGFKFAFVGNDLCSVSRDLTDLARAKANHLTGIPVANTVIDDFNCCDTAGTDNNDFRGDSRVDLEMPNGEGFYLQWTPTGGGAHNTQVSAIPPQIVTNVSDGVLGEKDSYQVGDLPPITGVIYGVQLVAYAQKADAGARSLQLLTRTGSTDQVSSAQALGTGANFYRAIVERDPTTSAPWTESGFNGAQFGVQVA